MKPLALSDLSPGEQVSVTYEGAAGSAKATRIAILERKGPDRSRPLPMPNESHEPK
jgi:hypothetical protein